MRPKETGELGREGKVNRMFLAFFAFQKKVIIGEIVSNGSACESARVPMKITQLGNVQRSHVLFQILSLLCNWFVSFLHEAEDLY